MTSPAIDEQELAPVVESRRSLRSGESWLILACLTMLYVVAVAFDSRRFVWFDELFTLDIGSASSLHQLWERVTHFDCNPPLVYLLSGFSTKLLGVTPFALRLPVMLEFYLASVALFFYLQRTVSSMVSGLAILMVWSSPIFYYATEARPYALVFMCFAFLLLSWDTAVRGENRRLALFGVAASTTVLLAAHVFAPLSWFPFVAAEAVRFWRRRKPDYALWAALLVPAVVIAMYLPLIREYGGLIVPPSIRASSQQIAIFFGSPFTTTGRAILLATFVLLLLPASRSNRRPTKPSPEALTIFALLLLNPILLNVIQMRRQGGFFDRYCITTSVVVYLAITILLAFRLSPSRIAAGTASLVMISMMAHNVVRTTNLPRIDEIPWASLRSDLPVVDASGITFYEMNHHEGPKLLSRLYYLKDRDAALRYEMTNYFQDFEAFDDMKRAGFPISANVDAYSRFIDSHHEFLVYGNPNEWLLRKLEEDGAKRTFIANYAAVSPYRDSNLYLVTIGRP